MKRNPTAIVTGASRGIGAATARRLADEGYAVCVNYRSNKEAAASVVDEIMSSGGLALAVQADVSDERDVIRLFETVDTEIGLLTALVNNAGILQTQTAITGMDAVRINKILSTNITSAFLCSREAVKRMSDGGGAIVNVSSVAARTGAPGEYIDYAASKGAIDTMTRGLAAEVASQGIRVNAVRPGFIYTDMHADGGEPGRVDRLASSIPLQRGGQAEEVAATIAWLLSDDASYVTGSLVDVAGGR